MFSKNDDILQNLRLMHLIPFNRNACKSLLYFVEFEKKKNLTYLQFGHNNPKRLHVWFLVLRSSKSWPVLSLLTDLLLHLLSHGTLHIYRWHFNCICLCGNVPNTHVVGVVYPAFVNAPSFHCVSTTWYKVKVQTDQKVQTHVCSQTRAFPPSPHQLDLKQLSLSPQILTNNLNMGSQPRNQTSCHHPALVATSAKFCTL